MCQMIAAVSRTLLLKARSAAGVLAVLAVSAGAAHAASPEAGGVHHVNFSSLLSAAPLIIGGLLMRYDTIQRT